MTMAQVLVETGTNQGLQTYVEATFAEHRRHLHLLSMAICPATWSDQIGALNFSKAVR